MKRIFAIVFSALMMLALISCGCENADISSYQQSTLITSSAQTSSQQKDESLVTSSDDASSLVASSEDVSDHQSSLGNTAQTSTSSAASSVKPTSSSQEGSQAKPSSSSQTSSEKPSTSVTVPEKEETVGDLVWVPVNGGTRYHTKSTCSKMKDPIQVSVETAVKNGYTPCKRCYK